MNSPTDTLASRIVECANAYPARRAVVCDGVSLTYEMLASKARACAGRLQDLGLIAGGAERVGILASNGLDFAIVVVACQISGIAIVPLPGLIAPDAQARMIDDAGIAVLFYDRNHAGSARAAVSLAGGDRRLVEIGDADAASGGGVDTWTAEGPCRFIETAIDDDWISDLIYSSGTTGVPKGISQSYGARKAQCTSLAQLGVATGMGLVQTVGLYSNFGLSALLLTLWWGGSFFTMRKFSGPATIAILSVESIDMAWFAPATLLRVIEAPDFANAVRGKSSVKVCAGAPLNEAQKQRVLDAWPGPFFDVYGQTETGTLTMLAIHAAPRDKLRSVGKVLASASVRILDDEGVEVPLGVEGEIAGHTNTLMSGYHQRDDVTTSAHWRDADGRLYVRTGDVGRFDADGYLWLCDRKKDMIISGGFNIYPADIERILSEHPAVFEVAVVGCASERWGETPVAFLTLRAGTEAQPDELRLWVNERVGSVQRVADVRIVSALPNGTMGKILKRELRESFLTAVGILP